VAFRCIFIPDPRVLSRIKTHHKCSTMTASPPTTCQGEATDASVRHSPLASPQGRGLPSIAASVRRSPRTPIQGRGTQNDAASVRRSPRTPVVTASIRRSPRTALHNERYPSIAAVLRRSPRTPVQGRRSPNVDSSSDQHLTTQNLKRASSAAVESRRNSKKSKASSTQTGGTGGRPPNYSEDEDFLIACAYVNVTVDPIKGVGQKSDNFWTRVHDRFVILSQKHNIENGIEIPFRNKESIEQRWKKKISKSVQLWNKFYRQVKSVERSGWNEEKYIEEAGNLYLSEIGEPFKYAKCVPVVHKLPKFDPMVQKKYTAEPRIQSPGDISDSDDGNNGDRDYVVKKPPTSSNKKKVNNSAPPQGSAMSRPIGMKKAKEIEKLKTGRSQAHAIELTGITGFDNASLAEMSAATKELVAAVKANTSLKREDLDARQHSKWMRMAEIYMGIGENEKAMAILSKIEEADAAGTMSTTNHDSEIKPTIEVECDINDEETF
jgi:No apical meristem-associated C-terminal domain